MRALVYEGSGRISLQRSPYPQIEAPTDTVLRLVKTTICGTGLHIVKDDVPTNPGATNSPLALKLGAAQPRALTGSGVGEECKWRQKRSVDCTDHVLALADQ